MMSQFLFRLFSFNICLVILLRFGMTIIVFCVYFTAIGGDERAELRVIYYPNICRK